jgi:hypothetical protein
MRAGAETLVSRRTRSHVPSVRIARLYAHAGENDQVLRWLHAACTEREAPLGHLGQRPLAIYNRGPHPSVRIIHVSESHGSSAEYNY